MRIDTKKFLFIGITEDLKKFLKSAQTEGIIHFIDTNPARVKTESHIIHDITAAIKILRGLPTAEQEESEEYSLAGGLAAKILQYKYEVDTLQEEERINNLEIERVAPFGDFSLEDIAFIEKRGA